MANNLDKIINEEIRRFTSLLVEGNQNPAIACLDDAMKNIKYYMGQVFGFIQSVADPEKTQRYHEIQEKSNKLNEILNKFKYVAQNNIERAQTGGVMMQMPDMTGGIPNEQPQYEQTPQQGDEEARELPSGYENRGFESSDYGLNQQDEHPEGLYVGPAEPEQEEQYQEETPVEYEQEPQQAEQNTMNEQRVIYLGMPGDIGGIGCWNSGSTQYNKGTHLYQIVQNGEFGEFSVIDDPIAVNMLCLNVRKYLYPCCRPTNVNYNPTKIVTDTPGKAQYNHNNGQWVVMNKAVVHYE